MTRRIVTGYRAGKSVFLSDDRPLSDGYPASMGFANVECWGAPSVPAHPAEGVPLATGGRLPAPGESQLLIVTFPPDSAYAAAAFDPVAAAAEQARLMPGIFGCFEPGNPGMHRTPTLDYVVVLDGHLVLELDDGATRTVSRGDVIVQNGTRHAWRNPGDRPATIAAILIGDAAAPLACSADDQP